MAEQVGYLELLRHNRAFRLLWYGQVASQLGDWLDYIALLTLLKYLAGSGSAIGGLLVAQTLPYAVVGPWAGVLIDRLPRKRVLIATDLLRAALVLSFLVVHEPGQLWLVYVISYCKFSLSAFYEPAREAVVPDVVPREHLVAANGMSGLTWSAMLAGGAALGGLVVAWLGVEWAFILDSLSFVLSAAFTWAVAVRETHLEDKKKGNALAELREGLAFLLARRDVALYAVSKALWCIGGGAVLVLLPLFGQDVFPRGPAGSVSLGLLYAARGVGAGLGPLMARHWGGDSMRALRRWLGPGFLLMAAGYLVLSGAPVLPVALLGLMVAHFGGSIQWVFSTTLLQLSVPARLQGRTFAAELAVLTLAFCASSYATGLAVDAGWSPQTLAMAAALLFVAPGMALALLLWRPPREEQAEAPRDGEPL